MSYKIVVDSCCELPENLKNDERFQVIPLELQVGEEIIVDDESFDQADFLKKVAASPKCPKSACPSPELYMNAYNCDAERVYVVTLSSKLSGSYNSAVLGSEMYYEEFGEKDIYVIDSLSASCGETQMVLKLIDLENEGLSFNDIIEKIEAFKREMKLYVVLDSLEALRKNGRLSNMKAVVANSLSIKLVLTADDGLIVEKSKAVGMKKALGKMADIIIQEIEKPETKRLIISHCNAKERAERIRDIVLSSKEYKECIILDTRGVSSLYASDGGVIVTA